MPPNGYGFECYVALDFCADYDARYFTNQFITSIRWKWGRIGLNFISFFLLKISSWILLLKTKNCTTHERQKNIADSSNQHSSIVFCWYRWQRCATKKRDALISQSLPFQTTLSYFMLPAGCLPSQNNHWSKHCSSNPDQYVTFRSIQAYSYTAFIFSIDVRATRCRCVKNCPDVVQFERVIYF